MQAKVDWSQFFLSPRGRINRELWWLGVIVVIICGAVFAAIFGQSAGFAFNLVLLFPYFILHIKRCHDRDKSGWWCLLLFLPMVGLFWSIVDLGLLEGTRGDNRYGADPLRGAN